MIDVSIYSVSFWAPLIFWLILFFSYVVKLPGTFWEVLVIVLSPVSPEITDDCSSGDLLLTVSFLYWNSILGVSCASPLFYLTTFGFRPRLTRALVLWPSPSDSYFWAFLLSRFLSCAVVLVSLIRPVACSSCCFLVMAVVFSMPVQGLEVGGRGWSKSCERFRISCDQS